MTYTIAQAVALDPEELSEMTMFALSVDEATKQATARTWLHLRGLKDEGASERVAVAMAEVLEDGELFVALNKPATEFVDWWREQKWESFAQHEAEGENDAWAFAVLLNAKRERDALGVMASQCAIRVA